MNYLEENDLEQRTVENYKIFMTMLSFGIYGSHSCPKAYESTVVMPLARAAAIMGLGNNEASYPKFGPFLDKILPPFHAKGEQTLPFNPRFVDALKVAQSNVPEYEVNLNTVASAKAIIGAVRQAFLASDPFASFQSTRFLTGLVEQLGQQGILPKSKAGEANELKAAAIVSENYRLKDLKSQILRGGDSFPVFEHGGRRQRPASFLNDKDADQLLEILNATNYIRSLVKSSKESLRAIVKANADAERKAAVGVKSKPLSENERSGTEYGYGPQDKAWLSPSTGRTWSRDELIQMSNRKDLTAFRTLMRLDVHRVNRILAGGE